MARLLLCLQVLCFDLFICWLAIVFRVLSGVDLVVCLDVTWFVCLLFG